MIEECEMYVFYQDSVLRVEEFGCMNDKFIFFNPLSQGNPPNFRIQFTEKVMLKKCGDVKMISIGEVDFKYEVLNSTGNVICDCENLVPEMVDILVNKMILDFELYDISLN